MQYPSLQLIDSAGKVLLSDNSSGGSADPGPGVTALLTYTVPATGTYYLGSDPRGNDIGTYKISATSLGAMADAGRYTDPAGNAGDGDSVDLLVTASPPSRATTTSTC